MERNIALIADDVELNRELLSDMLDSQLIPVEAENGKAALDYIEKHKDSIAIMLLDLMMPVMTGLDVLAALKERGLLESFPILIVTGETDAKLEEDCLRAGVYDFVKKPFNPAMVQHRIRNAQSFFAAKYQLEEKVAEQTRILQERNEQLRTANDRTIELLSDIVEARSAESGTHVRRVRGFTSILAKKVCALYPEYGLTEHAVSMITTASCMHDVGKAMIPDAVLLKPGKLTPEEFEIMKTHTVRGCDVLRHSRYLWDEEYYVFCHQICRHHHEKWDGRGYPDGLKGDEIPIAAQLVSVADCYDALTTKRVYKRAYTSEEAAEMILGGQCGAFNPKLLQCFTESLAEFEALAQEYSRH